VPFFVIHQFKIEVVHGAVRVVVFLGPQA